jgi:tetratricopeptide (TPR) repeat protein
VIRPTGGGLELAAGTAVALSLAPMSLLCVALLAATLAGPGRVQDSRPTEQSLAKLWTEQRYEELLARVEPWLKDSPEAARLWIMAAESALKLEDHDRAVRFFEKGQQLEPSLKALTINLGFAYLKVERAADARKVFEGFLRDPSPDRAGKAHYGLGLILVSLDDVDGARTAFTTATRLDPDDARPYYRLGQLHLQRGEHREAVSAFGKAIERDELHHGAAYGLARSYALLGESDATARWTERHRKILEAADAVANMIRRLGKADDPVRARLAIALKLQEAEARAKALPWFREVLRLDPDNDQARQALKALERPETRK